jgi:hypothetical protein
MNVLSRLTGESNSDVMGQAIEDMVGKAISRRKPHERRWYDNNFFDDGYHFRIISKKTGRVIDTTNKQSGYVERAIPKASRQVRGVTNLLFAAEPYPVVYPQRISISEFEGDQQAYMKAMEKAKDVARKQGVWITNEWEEQELQVKMIDMIIKAAKNSVAWLEVYSDPRKQKIITNVYDAFDVICFGDVDDERKLPFMTKACPMTPEEINASPIFDPAKVAKLTTDNKYATSEIKDAYMRSRYGVKTEEKKDGTIMVKETFIKEYLNDTNWERAAKLGQDTGAMEGKSKGDMVMRQVFSAGGVTLEDSYIDCDEYPLIPFRFEPGPLYQVPFIERFIPQNKSVDVIVTRLEKFVNAMVVGVYQRQKGENMQIANIPGGQILEYSERPLTQMNLANPGTTPFEVVNMLNNFIDEQGASTATMGQLPAGVKSGVAIESLKATEYANLKIPTLMLKQTIKRIADQMLERADKDYLKPVEVSSLSAGEPEYFDVVGGRRMSMPEAVNGDLPKDVIPLSRKLKVRIEIEPGLGMTQEGKKAAMKDIGEFMLGLYKEGFVSPEAMQMFLKRYVETYGYGSTEELMEGLENGMTGGQMTDNQLKQMQIAMVQALKDVGAVGAQADQKLVTASKIGTLQSLKDAGLLKGVGGDGGQGALEVNQKMKDTLTKIYKDSPPDVRRQIEQALGMQPSQEEDISPTQADSLTKLHGAVNQQNQTAIGAQGQQQSHALSEKQQALDHHSKQQELAQKAPNPDQQAFEQKAKMRELDIKEQQAKQKAQQSSQAKK